MQIDPRDWPRLSPLIDAALDLPVESRAVWLEGLAASHPDLVPKVAGLLADYARVESGDFLESLPQLSRVRTAQGASPEPGAVIGPYRLEALVGRGGMGTVWRARRIDGELKRALALKLPYAGGFDPDMLARFARERDILASLAHPNIARLYDAQVSSLGQPYLAMEFVEGVNLLEYCAAQGLGVAGRLAIFQQVLAAVRHAHAQLVIHRDLKPSNILVTAAGEVRLLDFGIARLIDGAGGAGGGAERARDALTQVGFRVLTPGYASPEQIAGAALGTASDIYSLGVLLFELLAGRRPDAAEIVNGDAPSPSQVAPRALAATLRGDLDAIVLKCLEPDPARRYATADALDQDLERLRRGEPVLARADSLWYRGGKFARRHRVGVIAAVAVVLALGVGAGLALWQMQVARHEAALARAEARTSAAVQQFLEDIFAANSIGQADPVKARETTARQLLDIGARRIASALPDSPSAKLRVLKTLSKMYDELDLYTEQAIRLARERVELARGVAGDQGLALTDALLDLSLLAGNVGQLQLSDRTLAEAGRLLERAPDAPRELRARYELGVAKQAYNADQKNARRHIDAVLGYLDGATPNMLLLDALEWQSVIARATGDFPGAIAAAQRGLRVMDNLGEQANGERSFVLSELGRDQGAAEDFDAAEHSLEQATQAALRVEGAPGGTLYLGASTELADLRIASSRAGLALSALAPAHAVALKVAAAGDRSTDPSWLLYREAKAALAFGRPEAALALLDAIDAMRKGLETRAELSASLLERRGEALTELAHYAEAEPLLRDATRLRTGLGQSGTPLMNLGVGPRVRLFVATSRLADAEAALAQFTVPAAGSPPPLLPRLERAVLAGEIALARGEAQAALEQALGAERLLPAEPARRRHYQVWEARASLLEGRARQRGGNCAAAIPTLTRALRLYEGAYDPQLALPIARAENVIAQCLEQTGERGAALAHRARARTIESRHPLRLAGREAPV